MEYGTEHGMTELTIFLVDTILVLFIAIVYTVHVIIVIKLTVQLSQVYKQDFAMDLHTPWVAGSAKFHIYHYSYYHCASQQCEQAGSFLQAECHYIYYLSGVRIEHVICMQLIFI